MKKILGLILLITNIGLAQNFNVNFSKYFEAKDTLNQRKTLENWEKAKPNDPELFTSYFNYYFWKSRDEVLTLSTQEPNSDAFAILKDSLNNTAGYLGSEISYKNKIFQKGINKIEKGIQLYPNRLDMRFGEIYVLGQVKEWKSFTKKIIQAIQYSGINKNKWTWTNNVLKEDGENFFLGGLQDYQLQLYATEDDKLLTNMADIATEVLKLYPNHVESLSNLSITYMLKNDFDKAIEVLLRAEKISTKDYIVLSNVAHAYKQKGDKLKAIEYYEKTVKYGDKNAIKDAKKQIGELKK